MDGVVGAFPILSNGIGTMPMTWRNLSMRRGHKDAPKINDHRSRI